MTGPLITPRRFAGGRLYSVNGTTESRTKPAALISASNWSSVRKHCGAPENWLNTNDSPGTGDAAAGRVFLEKVKTNRAAPGRATRAASAIARRISADDFARFQMPCATTRSALASATGRTSIG